MLLACGVVHRSEKALTPDVWMTEDAPRGELAEVRYATGHRHEPEQAYAPEVQTRGDRNFVGYVPLTNKGWVTITPLAPDATVAVYVRNTVVTHHEFHRVYTLSGEYRRSLPTEIRFLPEQLDEPFTLHINQPDTTSPVFSASLALGYRYPTRSAFGRWFSDHFSVVTTLGIGSTSLEDVVSQPDVGDQAGACSAPCSSEGASSSTTSSACRRS